MLRRLPLLLLVPLLAAALGGCADGKVREANDYVGAVNAAQGRFAATSERLLREIAPDDRPAKNGAALSRFYSAVDGFVDDLRGIDPPPRVAALHRRLIAAVSRFGTDLRTAGAAITSRSASRILRGQEQLASATSGVAQRINSTIGAINQALKR